MVLEHSAVSRVGVDLQSGVRQPACHVGRVAAVDHEVVVAVCDEDGLGDERQVVGLALAGVPDGFELSDTGLHRDSFVAVVGALLEAVEIVRRGAFALGGSGKEQEVPGIAERQGRFEVGDDGDLGDLVDSAAAARTRAGEDHSSHEFRRLQGDHLGDTAAERKPEEVNRFETQSANEGDRVGAHLLDRVWHRRARRADTAIVEGDHAMVRGDTVNDSRIPVVENRGQVVQEHHRNV